MHHLLEALLENTLIPSYQNVTKLKLLFLLWSGTGLVFSRLCSLLVKLAGFQ